MVRSQGKQQDSDDVLENSDTCCAINLDLCEDAVLLLVIAGTEQVERKMQQFVFHLIQILFNFYNFHACETSVKYSLQFSFS